LFFKLEQKKDKVNKMKHNLRKKLIAALVMAAMVMGGAGVAQCHITTPPSSNTYAIEAVNSQTIIPIVPNGQTLVYRMDIQRPFNWAGGSDFRIRYEVIGNTSGNGLFSDIPIVPNSVVINDPAPVPGVAVATFTSGGPNNTFAEYHVQVNASLNVGTEIILNGLVRARIGTIPVNEVSQARIRVTLFDGIGGIGSTSILDTPATATIGTFAFASNFTTPAGTDGVIIDPGTTVDAGFAVPLAGFVVQNGDTISVADADVRVRNTTPGVLNPVTMVDHVLTAGDSVILTITDQTGFSGITPGGFLWWDANGNGFRDTTPNETFVITGNTATCTVAGNLIGPANQPQGIYYQANGTNEMDAPRVLTIQGTVQANGSGGQSHLFQTNISAPASWWSWDAPTGVTLQAPFFQVPPGWNCRFVLTNTRSNPANYTTRLFSTPGRNVIPGPLATGVIPANGTLVLESPDVIANVTGAGAPRGTAIFRMNDAPSASIQGLYQLVNTATGAVTNHVMVRPGTN